MANQNKDYDNNKKTNNEISLDDDQRIKVLSPTALVLKRFFRNKLSITGLVFIIGMFLFSFVGGWMMPYDEDQVFKKYEERYKIYAGITENDELKYIIAAGEEFPLVARSQFVLATSKEGEFFESDGSIYMKEKIDDDYYIIYGATEVGIAMTVRNDTTISTSDNTLDAGFATVAKDAIQKQAGTFEYNSKKYIISYNGKNSIIYRAKQIAVATKNIFDYSDQSIGNEYTFCKSVEDTLRSGRTEFIVDNIVYSVKENEGIIEIIKDSNVYANVSRYQIEPLYDDVFFDLEFKKVIRDAIDNEIETFTYQENDDKDSEYRLSRQNLQWTLEHVESTYLIDEYHRPSKEHIMGTDGHGMDILTRLMYGGRISLRIGFIVVIVETILGVMLGGVAGYFGKFWDNFIMRIVDVFNCIPRLPLIIILGAVMDQVRTPPETRLNILMLILAILGWPGVARMVRGQILSLREQEFMTATEATGIRVSKRIFKHLVPNVMPQLIVICTLNLGYVILLESVLSFLGVGVKFPFASWGNIINAVSNVHVMSNYLFVWIPAGMLILITVLGFNFIGDGLRDAFDPKMKR